MASRFGGAGIIGTLGSFIFKSTQYGHRFGRLGNWKNTEVSTGLGLNIYFGIVINAQRFILLKSKVIFGILNGGILNIGNLGQNHLKLQL